MALVWLIVAKYETIERALIGFSARRSSLLYRLILQETLLFRRLQDKLKPNVVKKQKFFVSDVLTAHAQRQC